MEVTVSYTLKANYLESEKSIIGHFFKLPGELQTLFSLQKEANYLQRGHLPSPNWRGAWGNWTLTNARNRWWKHGEREQIGKRLKNCLRPWERLESRHFPNQNSQGLLGSFSVGEVGFETLAFLGHCDRSRIEDMGPKVRTLITEMVLHWQAQCSEHFTLRKMFLSAI